MKDKLSQSVSYSLAFFLLTLLVAKQATAPFDLFVTTLFQRFDNRSLDLVFYVLTLMGHAEISFSILAFVCWYLYRKYEWAGVFHYLFLFIILSGVELLWKNVVCYPGPGPEFNRNPFDWHLITIYTPYSFPSGHMFRSAFLLGLWYQWIKRLGNLKTRAIGLQKTLIFVLLIGIAFSRVYLGDHWLSDVVGGLLLAGIGLSLISEPARPEFRPA
jgi:undecaprenyl-diphosphatase